LIGARVLQGVGAAALTPTSLSMLLPLFGERERPAVIGAWAALGGVGAAMDRRSAGCSCRPAGV